MCVPSTDTAFVERWRWCSDVHEQHTPESRSRRLPQAPLHNFSARKRLIFIQVLLFALKTDTCPAFQSTCCPFLPLPLPEHLSFQ